MDMKLAEKQWQEQLEKMKIDAIADASLLVQLVAFEALWIAFQFDLDDIAKFKDTMDMISDRIGDKDGEWKDYSLSTVKESLASRDIEVESDWI